MKRSCNERDENLTSLRYSLNQVVHTGMLFIWLYEYLLLTYYKPADGKCICSTLTCLEMAPDIYENCIDAIARLRNAYVHKGVLSIQTELQEVLSCDSGILKELFNAIDLPENASNVFWTWYESKVMK